MTLKERIKAIINIYKDKGHRTALLATFSTARNLAYSLGMLFLGLLSWSSLLLVNGSYQLILSLIRLLNIRSYSLAKVKKRSVAKRESIVPITGALIVLLGISYLVINIHFYLYPPVEHFAMWPAIMTATLAFAKMGSSLWGFFRNRQSKDPEIVSIRLLSLVDATVSIVTTQRVILTMEEGSAVAANSTPLFGMAVSGCFVLTGLYMMLKKRTNE